VAHGKVSPDPVQLFESRTDRLVAWLREILGVRRDLIVAVLTFGSGRPAQ
jgi:hypothetical protein